jgi:hypothetical protein
MSSSIPYNQLDTNIISLVEVLNSLPGIKTLGSCGGHENPTSIQQPLGEWFVSFYVAHTKGGMRSLEYIAGSLSWSNRRANLEVSTSAPGYATGRALFFVLSGWDFLEPDDIAKIIAEIASDDGLVLNE